VKPTEMYFAEEAANGKKYERVLGFWGLVSSLK